MTMSTETEIDPTNGIDEAVVSDIRSSVKRARFKYALPPLLALGTIVGTALPLSFTFRLFNYLQVMPVLLFISGVFVMFIGAFWDFGAKLYVADLVEHNLPFGDEDLNYVFKQQFILTSIYLGIGMLYLASAFMIFLI